MTVVNPDSIAGITSVTSSGTTLQFYDVNGNLLDVSANLTGELTVGVGATISSPAANIIDFETNGSEKLRIAAAGQLGIAGANYGNSGQVLTSGGSGSSMSWATPTVTVINNNADNRIITGSGTAGTLEAESTLQWSGNALSAYRDNATTYGPGITAHHQRGTISSPAVVQTNDTLLSIVAKGYDGANSYDDAARIDFKSGSGTPGSGDMPGTIVFSTTDDGASSSTARVSIQQNGNLLLDNSCTLLVPEDIQHVGDTDTKLRFTTNTISLQTAGTEWLQVASDGKILLAGANSYHADADDLVLKERSGGNVGMTFQNSGTGYGVIYFADNSAQHSGRIQYDHSNDSLDLFAGGGERVSIDANGMLHISDRNSATAGEHVFQAGAFGIRMQDTGGYNRWHIERNYGGWQSNPVISLSSQGRVGVGTAAPTALLHTYNTSSDGLQVQASGYHSYVWQIQANNNLNNGSVAGDLALRGHSGISMSANAGSATQFRLGAADLSVTGTTDGVVNLDTSDGRGCFIRYKQGGTTQAWAGIPQGFGAGGNTDFGIRSNRHIYFLTGGGNQRWSINTDGTIYPAANNTYNIGGNSSRVNKMFSNYWVHRTGNSSGNSWNEQEAIHIQGGFHFFHDNITLSTSNFTHGACGNRSYDLMRLRNSGSGSAIYAENGSISSGSDYRMKENVAPITGAIDVVKKLKPCTYNIKKSFNEHDAGGTHQGFIAHEVQEAIPNITNIVQGTKDAMEEIRYMNEDTNIPAGKKPGDGTGVFTDKPNMQGIDYGHMTPILAAAIKELIAKVESLEAEAANDAAYEAKIDKLIDYFKL